MPDKHYPDENYGAGVPDLSGLDFAVDMMRNAPAKLDLHEQLDALRAEVERLKGVTGFKEAVACVFDYLKTTAANTSDRAWDDQLEELAEDVIEYAPEYKKQWRDICELTEQLRQAKITEGGLRRTLDGVQQRAQHTQKTNRDLIGRNERLNTRVAELQARIKELEG